MQQNLLEVVLDISALISRNVTFLNVTFIRSCLEGLKDSCSCYLLCSLILNKQYMMIMNTNQVKMTVRSGCTDSTQSKDLYIVCLTFD